MYDCSVQYAPLTYKFTGRLARMTRSEFLKLPSIERGSVLATHKSKTTRRVPQVRCLNLGLGVAFSSHSSNWRRISSWGDSPTFLGTVLEPLKHIAWQKSTTANQVAGVKINLICNFQARLDGWPGR